ncbi:hypothetical protein I4U23_021248 [Adineta vaga]|nr:hypothetical protein I4U23_021248 [Adineta vaga]
MIIEKLLFILLFIPIISGLPSNSFYLIELDQKSSSNETYCSNIFTNQQTYRLPKECHKHLLCDPYYCDDKSFRCMKIRETLCCLHQYFQSHCQEDNVNRLKDQFRSVYFQISIEHGYCEINLERIEKNDQAYCIADIIEEPKSSEAIKTTTTTTMILLDTSTRSTFKHFYRRTSTIRSNRHRHRIAIRPNYSSLANLDYLRQVTIIEENISSKCSRIFLHWFSISILLSLAFLLK